MADDRLVPQTFADTTDIADLFDVMDDYDDVFVQTVETPADPPLQSTQRCLLMVNSLCLSYS